MTGTTRIRASKMTREERQLRQAVRRARDQPRHYPDNQTEIDVVLAERDLQEYLEAHGRVR